MPSLLSRIDTELDASGVAAVLADSIERLGNAQGLLDDVSSGPTAAIGRMATALQGVGVPELDAVKSLVADFQALSQRVPDPTDLTGALDGGLAGLISLLDADLIAPLGRAIDAIQAAANLLPGDEAAPAAPGAVLLTGAVGAGSPATAALAEVDKALDLLPSPLTVEGFLVFLRDLFREFPLELIPAPGLPVVTEFQRLLDTVLTWRELSGPQLADALRATLESLAAFIPSSILGDAQQTVAGMQTLAAHVPLETLRSPMQGLEQGLVQLAAVVVSGDLSTVGTRVGELNTRLSQVNAALAPLATNVLGGQAEALVDDLAQMPAVLDRRMREVLAVVTPPSPSVGADAFANMLGDLFDPVAIDDLLGNVENLLVGLRNVVDGLNLEAIRAPLLAAVNAAQGVVADLDRLLIELTSAVKLLFDDLAALVDKLDVARITGAVQEALADVQDLVRNLATSLFEPVRQAVVAAIQGLQAATSAIGVDDVVNAVRDVVERFGAILGDPEVVGALNAAQAALDEATAALDGLSFASATDEVVADIDKVTAALQKIDPNALPDPVRRQLKSAVAVLPTDFDPIVQTITTRFDDLVEAGPRPFLVSIKDKPQLLADHIEDFAPEKLIGDKLASPYGALIDELATFRPSQLLQPVRDALAELVERLEGLNPAALLAPLDNLHAELLAGFSRLDPTELIGPLAEQVNAVIDGVVARLPVDAIFDRIDRVLQRLQTILSSLDAARGVIDKAATMLGGLGSADAQVRQLVDAVLARISQITNLEPLSAAFAHVAQALASIGGAGIEQAVGAPLASLLARLGSLDAGGLHAAVVRAYRDFPRATVEALPASAQRTQILALLNAFNPLAVTFARPFTALQAWRAQLTSTQASLLAFLPAWDALYLRSDGPFADFLRAGISATELRQILGETIASSFDAPLRVVFGLMERTGGTLSRLARSVGELVAHVQAQLSNLLLIPQAMTAIRGAMQQLLTTIQALDLTFLADEARLIFLSVRSKLVALDPAQIRAAVEAAFKSVIDSLTLEKLLPANAVRQLDQSYEQVLTTLRGVDPTRLIVEVVQPEFEAAIKPLLEVIFSLSALLEALVERLDGLGDELDQGLSRTGDAFERMVRAVPA